MEKQYDVVVVGGGAAGLSGAVALARSRRSVLVVDAGEPRNAPAEGVHNYLGREGTPPRDLLALGRQELEGYGGTVVAGRAVAARAVEGAGSFEVSLADGRVVVARRLLVATGLTDELPDVPGVRELWGRDVLHCPYCHGWEVRDRAIGVLGTSPMSGHQALLFSQLSGDVTLFAHTLELPDDERGRLTARGVRIREVIVAGLESEGGRLLGVRLGSGELVAREVAVVAPVMRARSGLLDSLGLAPVDQEMGGHVVGSSYPVVDPTGASGVPGVWLAGNVCSIQAQVVVSAAAGLSAGARINADLIEEEVRVGVGGRLPLPFGPQRQGFRGNARRL
ncbi:NAD(P)/FAD-dependent oxidoreductase [Nocardioides pacificus]